MIFTNKNNLPAYLHKILTHEYYGGANVVQDFSTTQFGNPVTMTILQHRHKDEIVSDSSDALMRVLGSGVHAVCEMALSKEPNMKLEERLFVNVHGKVIGGQYDLYLTDSHTLIDFKLTKANSYIFGGRESKYSSQMNINKYILEKNGYMVDKMDIVEIYRDWDEKKAKIDTKYPPKAINITTIPAVTSAITEYRLKEYIDEYEKLKNTPDNLLPPCPPKDRWERGASFAVMKRGASRAVKLFETKDEATAFINSGGVSVASHYIEERVPVPLRCIDGWCEVCSWCPFYADYMRKEEEKKGNLLNEKNTSDNKSSREFSDFI